MVNWLTIKALLRRLALSDGERGVLFAAAVLAVIGAALAFAVVGQISGSSALLRPLRTIDLWFVISGAIGSLLGLYLGRNWLGHSGWSGLRKLVIGAGFITGAGGVCAGTIALPFYGTMFGPFLLITTFVAHPALAAFWLIVLLGCHLMIAEWRRERWSLFALPPDHGIPT